MARRVEALLLPVGLKAPLIATFHAACVRILRQHGRPHRASAALHDLRRGRSREPRQGMHEGARSDRTRHHARRRRPAHQLLEEPHARRRRRPGGTARGPWEEKIALVFGRYEERLRAVGGVDFDDLLLKTVQALRRGARGGRLVSRALASRARRRVPGHQPRPVPDHPLADRRAPEHLRRRRS